MYVYIASHFDVMTQQTKRLGVWGGALSACFNANILLGTDASLSKEQAGLVREKGITTIHSKDKLSYVMIEQVKVQQ